MNRFYYALVFLVSFAIFTDVFLPKERIVSSFLQKAENSGVSVLKLEQNNSYAVKTSFMEFTVQNPSIGSFLYLTTIKADSIASGAFANFKLSGVKLQNSPLSPRVFEITAKSVYGDIAGELDLKSGKISLDIEANKEFEGVKPLVSTMLKKELVKKERGYGVEFSY